MKKRNKIISLFIIGILPMLLGVIPNVFAVEQALTEQATITITGVDANDKLAAYKVLDAYKNEDTNEITYKFTTDFQTFLTQSENYQNLTVAEYTKLTSGDITSGSTKTSSTLDTLASAYASYVKRNNITGIDMTTTDTTATVETTVGTYLILPKETKRVYAVMVGNLDYKEQDGAWVKNNATITAKVSNASLTKTITTENVKEKSFAIGQEFSYKVVGTVPAFPTNATNKTYIIKDTFSTGLTFAGIENVVIKDGEVALTTNAAGEVKDNAGSTVATITFANQVMTITFNTTYVTSTTVTVEYKATLNNQAVLGEAGNGNSAVLTYANDPYGQGTYTTEEETATAYTYGLKVLKYKDEDGNRKVLKGADFALYSDENLTKVVGALTTDDTGYGEIKGLEEGTYYLKETKAPAGYILSKNVVEVRVDASSIEKTGANSGYKVVEIENKKAGILPFTGGMGTMIYTLVGCMIVIVSITGYVMYQKKAKSKI